ncbi:secretory pathway Sec39 [Westerdykella ornata]|uniref:Secretory pathway Sec39 n=1 Tax=Westerdykella ornata TaxID=318751 RepID=A0A6A6JH76_WESOR|nr:secretory pathway Sec39 [Westerdykella ornata]KAF2275463.1 secretory pathway Sec39 [Westerdykella ornata]
MENVEELSNLSTHHCVLLAAQYATESNISALRTLTAIRKDDLEFGLILRLLLAFLPEALEPSRYTLYLSELATNSRTFEDTPLDLAAVHELSETQSRKKARKLHALLQPLAHPLYKSETELDPFSHFLIHRSHRIDAETGLLEFVPQLVAPFLHHSTYLRTWFVSTVLPLLRLGYEYYPQQQAPSLDTFAQWKGKQAIGRLLWNLRWKRKPGSDTRDVGRDLRGIVGPWMCGSHDRKRRGLDPSDRRLSMDANNQEEPDDWEALFEWLVHTSKDEFSLTSSAFTKWDGPDDIDFGGFDEGQIYLDDARRSELERRYVQAGLASIYIVNDTSQETILKANSVLARLYSLLRMDPHQLTVGVESLPRYDFTSPVSHESPSSILQEGSLLQPGNHITRPGEGAVRLAEHFIFSAHLLSNLHYSLSVRELARMYLRSGQAEQLLLVQKLIHNLTRNGSKMDATQWKKIRTTLLWLWDWGTTNRKGDRQAQGIIGRIDIQALETEILKAFLENSEFPLVVQTYLQPAQSPLPLPDVEKIILGAAMNYYDNASNGNRTRGGMKRASDLIAAMKPHFPNSTRFQRAEALLSATHAMSFYSLTLQHGVPFQPVNIRVSADPLSLLQRLLSQNPSSYTHLDDLIFIGQNLVLSKPSTLMDDTADDTETTPSADQKKKAATERRVIAMAIESALDNDDFETAYSYVMNRLSPPSNSPLASPVLSISSYRFSFGSHDSDDHTGDDVDDVSWRAALRAGRYHPSLSISGTWSTSSSLTSRPDLRWLDQRMDLLSQALLLAPPSRLEQVLSEWQQCEKETEAILEKEAQEEQRFNDFADRRLPGAFAGETVPGVQPRREVGRRAVEEAPMGLFDVARGAAKAFSKTAFPLRGIAGGGAGNHHRAGGGASDGRVSVDLSDSGGIGGGSTGGGGEGRTRRRDMVASAVTGGLASGIGWVLGATPVQDRDRT